MCGVDAYGEAVHVYLPSLVDTHHAPDALGKLHLLGVGIGGRSLFLKLNLHLFTYPLIDAQLFSKLGYSISNQSPTSNSEGVQRDSVVFVIFAASFRAVVLS
jgi:hypothetical protein